MKKNKKKNLKKVQAKIDNTPVKTEDTKKAQKVSKEQNKTADKAAKAAANKAAKAEKQAKKYAASKARIEARNARKKSIMDKSLDTKKITSPEGKIYDLASRKEAQVKRRKLAEIRHIKSIKRRCARMKLDADTTNKVVKAAERQWNMAATYNVTIICDPELKKRKEMEKIVKDCKITSACITNSTAFFKNVPKSAIGKLHDLLGDVAFYQYRADVQDSPFKEAGVIERAEKKTSPKKKGGSPHSIECSKIRNINGYNLRKLKQTHKKAMLERLSNKKLIQAGKATTKKINKAA